MLKILATALAALVLAVSAPARAADDHHHHGHDEAPTTLQFDGGKQWRTDATLRRSMGDINGAMAKALPRIHADQFDDGAYQALAATVSQKVGYAVAHCKLEARADAMLHLVIADLLAGAETMAGKGTASRHDGAVQVLQALDAYGKYFRHPGWKTAGK